MMSRDEVFGAIARAGRELTKVDPHADPGYVLAAAATEVLYGELVGLDLAYDGRISELTRRLERLETLARMAGATSTLP